MSIRARADKLISVLSSVLIVVAVGYLASIYFPVAREEFRYGVRTFNRDPEKMYGYTCPDDDFVIDIPELGICARVITDVDPLDSRVYQRALSQGVAQAKGTGKPGEGKNIFIFAHSSADLTIARRFNSVFYLLHKLETGDVITLRYDGSLHEYRVSGRQIVAPASVEYLRPGSHESLTLMTCWPPGTTLKRLIITAEPQSALQ